MKSKLNRLQYLLDCGNLANSLQNKKVECILLTFHFLPDKGD